MVLNNVISTLLLCIQIQQKIIIYLVSSLLSKNLTRNLYEDTINKPYRKLQIDQMPVIEAIEKLDYHKLLINYQLEHGKELKPVKNHKDGKHLVSHTVTCPRCNAPHQYLYDNTGGRGQFKCKVCSSVFNLKNRFSKSAILRCPHCSKVLERIKERKDFYIYKCKNNHCSFYKNNLSAMSEEEKKLFEKSPHEFKVRYIFREFNFDFKPLSKNSPTLPKVDLSRIYASSHTLGLILTYHVNYGISARKTACLMKDIHNVNISHQTILNYADAVSCILKSFVEAMNTIYPIHFVVMKPISV